MRSSTYTLTISSLSFSHLKNTQGSEQLRPSCQIYRDGLLYPMILLKVEAVLIKSHILTVDYFASGIIIESVATRAIGITHET